MSTTDTKDDHARPTLLKPPATIVSPPSPTDTKDIHTPRFEFSPHPPSPSPSDDENRKSDSSVIEYDSPEEEEDMAGPDEIEPKTKAKGRPKPRLQSGTLSPESMSPSYLTCSPRSDPSLRLPDVSDPSGSNPPSRAHTTRSPSPSSPRFRPKGMHHRRTSSTHRVRETTDGHQTSTSDGDRMINQYKIGKSLGKGAYATVELAIDVGSGTEYAIKEFSKSRLHYQALQEKHRSNTRDRNRRLRRDQNTANEGGNANVLESGPQGRNFAGTKTIDEDPLGLIRREIAIMKKLDHPHIVHLFEAISVPTADALFLVLDYMPGGTLMEVHVGQDDSKARPPYSLEQSREYFRQLCLGLEYLHANEVIHRDVKPDNVLLSADRQIVKLCDFGVSEMFTNTGDDRVKQSKGSPAFLSPESFTNQSHELHGKAVDIWALGVTLYCMFTGTLPFNLFNPLELFTAVREKEPTYPDEWEDAQKDLLQQMLCKDPQKRIVMSRLREHPWVTEHGENPMIDTEDNLFELGKHVEEPTQEELKNAFSSLRGIFTVIRAVQKLQLNRRSMSGHSQSHGTNREHPSGSGAGPSRGASMDQSTDASMSMKSGYGSMDSYVSQTPTDATSVSENDHERDQNDKDQEKELGDNPRSMSEDTEHGSVPKPKSRGIKLDKIDTQVKKNDRGAEDEEGVIIVDSPTSDTSEKEEEEDGSVTMVDSPLSDEGENKSENTPRNHSG